MISSRLLLQWIFALALLQPVIAVEWDTVSSGNYRINLCDADLPSSHAPELQDLLAQVYSGLQNVITDLQLGTASRHGYSAFFKDDSSKAEVAQVYERIGAGANVTVGHEMRRPTFVCANNGRRTDLLFQHCIEGNSAVLNWGNSEIVPLCPIFWSIQPKPTSSDCPLVSGNNRPPPSDQSLLQNQEALLVGNLVHFYHSVSSRYTTKIADVVAGLNASGSLLNPATYALYYAGK